MSYLMTDAELEKLRDDVIEFRVRNNMTQKEFSRLAKISTQTLWLLENDKVKGRKLTALTMGKIKMVLDRKEKENV